MNLPTKEMLLDTAEFLDDANYIEIPALLRAIAEKQLVVCAATPTYCVPHEDDVLFHHRAEPIPMADNFALYPPATSIPDAGGQT